MAITEGVHLKMVRVSNCVRMMQRKVTCHIDLETTGLTDTVQGIYVMVISIKKNGISTYLCRDVVHQKGLLRAE